MNIKRTKALLSAGSLAVAALLSTGPIHAKTSKPTDPAAAVAQPTEHRVTEEQFRRYFDLFNKRDPAWSDILAEKLVYPHPSGKTFHNRFWTDEGKSYTFENGMVIHSGEVWEGSAVILYELKDGKITSIRGATTGVGPVHRIS